MDGDGFVSWHGGLSPAESLGEVRPREEEYQEGSSVSARVCASAVRGHSPALLSASDWMDAGCAERRKRSAPPALTVKRGEGVGEGGSQDGAYGNQVSSAGPVAEPDFSPLLSAATR